MQSIQGKTALVTGAAGGIGRAISQHLAAAGAHLQLWDCDAAAVEETARALRAAGHVARATKCDLSDPQQIDDRLQELLARDGGVDILVNNAGVTYYGKTHVMTDADWERVMQVNIHAPTRLTRRLMPQMLRRTEGHVVNVCSLFGTIPYPRLTAYTTSKFALVGFTEAIRAEYGRVGIGATAICPGFVKTALFANAAVGRDRDENRVPPDWICTTADRVAARTLRAVYRNERLVIVQPLAHLVFNERRLFPGIVDRLFHLGRRRRARRRIARLKETGSLDTIPSFSKQLDGTSKTSPPAQRAA